jgi:hypothetical protein
MLKQPLKNHIAVLLDVSISMRSILPQVKTVFQNQIEFLRKKSILAEQETRVSVYTFSDQVQNLIYDVDVARPMEIDTLKSIGNTALLDAVGMSLDDFTLLPEKYGDHSFILYLLTDGEENSSRKFNPAMIKQKIAGLPENYSVCAFAPSRNSMELLEAYGIPKGNIEKWDTTEAGIKEVGLKFEQSMDNFYVARTKGIRASSTVFSDLSKLTLDDVKTVAKEVKNYQIIINEDVKAVYIKPLVETKLNINYVKGRSFYELVKNETVQEDKEIAIQDKKTGKVYVGYDARAILNLPRVGSVKITPVQSPKWNIYVQSNAVNRNVIPKQRVLVLT